MIQRSLDDGCPCDTGRVYGSCCGRFHAGNAPATALELMRSRYSAYVLEREAYLLDTWAAATRPTVVGFDRSIRWVGLEIIDQDGGGLFDETGSVTFGADHEVGGLPQRLLEKSRFVREDRQWRYVDAEQAMIDA